MSETRERSALDPRDRLAVMVSMAGSYIEAGRGDDALAVMRTVAEDVATEIARLTRELEEARRERSAARAEAMTAQASLRRAKRELEAARERERRLREAHERSVGVFRRACEIAEAAILAGETPETASARLRDAIESDIAEINALVALATPQEVNNG